MTSTTTDLRDGVSTSVAIKAPVRSVCTSNITASGLSAITTIDGSLTPAVGDRFLLTAQTSSVNNGIYVAGSGTWERAKDFDTNRDVRKGTLIRTQLGVQYRVSASDPITIGTTAITFAVDDNSNLATALASTAVDQGADLVSINDANSRITATTVEDALQEIAADGWVTPARLSFDVGYSRVIGASCFNNSGTPNTQYDMDCDVVVLYKSSDGGIEVRVNPGAAITNNVSTAGPAANGRDQSGAFSAGSWVHFYWIWNGTTLATLSSATAPPTGPTLPTGYTHWAYAGAVRFNGSSQLVPTYIRGKGALYRTRQSILTGGTATAFTVVDSSSLVPPNAESFSMGGYTSVTTDGSGVSLYEALISIDGTNTFGGGFFAFQGLANSQAATLQVTLPDLPNAGQQFYYRTAVTTGSSPDANYWIHGYAMPNGG